VVIALVKDVPDVKGGQQFGIRSFSVRLGQPAVRLARARAPVRELPYTGVAAALALGAARASTATAGARRAAVAALSVATIRSVRRRAEHVEPSDDGMVYMCMYGLYMPPLEGLLLELCSLYVALLFRLRGSCDEPLDGLRVR
jgi:4-hydroxybenzoate polyprenyltransferase